jgi:hypothetical protein
MRRRPSARIIALAAALLVLAFAAVDIFIPYLTRERETVSGVPVPPPFAVQENIRLRSGEQLCLGEVAMDVDSQIAEFTVIDAVRSGPPLRVSAAAPGYQAVTRIDGGYGGPQTIRVALEPPGRSLLAEFCIANRGSRKVDLLGTHEPRTASRPVARVDGREVPPDLTLRFLAEDSGDVVSRLGSLIDRMSAFHPPILEKPVLWALLALTVLVLPAAAIYGVVSSFRADD